MNYSVGQGVWRSLRSESSGSLMMVALFQSFPKNHPSVLFQEMEIYSKKYGYAGRTDLICQIGQYTCLVDFKTGSIIQEGSQWNWTGHYQDILLRMFPSNYIHNIMVVNYKGHKYGLHFGGSNMYPEEMVKPMQAELTDAGFNALHTAADVESALKAEGTTLSQTKHFSFPTAFNNISCFCIKASSP